MSELSLIKEEIFEKELLKPLLESMGCEDVRPTRNGSRMEGSRPNGSNNRGFSVFLDERLGCKVWTKDVDTSDIFDLVSYFHFGKESSSEIKRCLPKSKDYIVQTLGLRYDSNEIKSEDDPNNWLKQIQKKRSKRFSLADIEPNPTLPETILNEFVQLPHIKWIDDGLDYETLMEFEIGFDIPTERITFPIRDRWGNIVGVKGRRTNSDDDSKYLFIYPFQKSKELFNLYRAVPYIQEKREIILLEAEKSVMKANQMGHRNTVSQMGSELTRVQAGIIERLFPDCKIIIAMDRDKGIDDVKKIGKVFEKKENVYAIYDTDGLLNEKDSPVDLGVEVFKQLYNECCFSLFPNK